jgi:hypothetical protein
VEKHADKNEKAFEGMKKSAKKGSYGGWGSGGGDGGAGPDPKALKKLEG